MTAHPVKPELSVVRTRPAITPEEARHYTLIEMHHPAFKHGYQAGRNSYFRQEAGRLTDKQLVACLETSVQEGLFTEDDEGTKYFIIGQLIGQLSGPIIPRQPSEEDEAAHQTRLLAEVAATYGESQQTDHLKATITTLWQTQDELATQLDEDTYERVLCRDAFPMVYR